MKEECKKLELAIANGKVYHPNFQYMDSSAIDFQHMIGLLDTLEFDDSVIGTLYRKMRQEKLYEIHMYRAIGRPNEFSEASCQLYGKPDQLLKDECLRILNLKKEPEEAVFDAVALKTKFEEILLQYHFNFWKVILCDNIGSKVLVGDRKIWVNTNYRFSKNDILRLCAHEISTHVLRDENGKLREDSIFSDGTSHCMETEEGLAIYNEELAGALSVQTLKLYAARFLCALYMNDMSLYELTLMIQEYIGLQQAIYVASRMKVGLNDTSVGGGFNKDFVYLQGYDNVKNAVEADPAIYQQLYYGRIALSDLELLKPDIRKLKKTNGIILPIIERKGIL